MPLMKPSDYPKRFESYAYWRKRLANTKLEPYIKGEASEEEFNKNTLKGATCPICSGFMRVHDPREAHYTEYFCLCSMVHFYEQRKVKIGYETQTTPARLNELLPMDGDKSLPLLKSKLSKFVASPYDEKPWFYISGGKGCGKTHILRAMKSYYKELAFYTSAETFQTNLHRALNKGSDLDPQLYINWVATAPILLFDDLGIEYKNSEYFTAQLALVVNMRYNLGPKHYPLIMTSNEDITTLTHSLSLDIQRIGSRLSDTEISQVHMLQQRDFRLPTEVGK